jgi:hypothetical protein
VQRGDVAEPDQQFGPVAQGLEVEQVEQAGGAIAAACSDDPRDRRVIDGVLQLFEAPSIGAGQKAMAFEK